MRPRHAIKADLPDVEALLQSCALPTDGIRDDTVKFHVSRDKTGLLGCAGIEILDNSVGLLRGVAVAERARRAGLAALLVSALVADVRLHGIESLVVSTNSAADYFSRLGFSPVDRTTMPPELLASPKLSNGAARNMVLMSVEL
ncbi:GNAT family N-acetyltransferase [Cupriavidus necator]|uniref:GNAT family N-acetyltransferase n=1 Tax=Cupriavidus necator TaxID=106590 RepID=A0A1U9UJD8_CUPNE|nr:GNAT family N-acetyltransferase [Cupriavidus necator]AQV92547.1 GNAT family N-acetyltransferase [Cupriavidus necator]